MKSNSCVYITANGCPESRIDSARMAKLFKKNGWKVENDFRKADIIFFNACGLTEDIEKNSLRIINYLKAKKNPSTEFVVWGCLPKINDSCIREIYQGITFGSDDLTRLDEMFAFEKKAENIHANFLIPIFHFGKENKNSKNFRIRRILVNPLQLIKKYSADHAINVYGPGIFPIKVSTGCLNNCSYCGVRLSRGNLKSKSIDSVIKEVKKGLEKNYKEFGLIGSDVGAYGRDLGVNLVILLREIIKIKGDFKIRLRNIQPRFLIKMMPELREIFKTGKISYLATAAESGNDRILSLMNRGYTISNYKEAIRIMNKEFPKIMIRNQLMVGFPTESEEDFKDTCRLLDEVSFDYVEVYMFQSRPGTRAAEMKGQINRKTKIIRYYRLLMKTIFNERKRKKAALLEYKKRLEAHS
ncbi:MAG: MiaB/RimO family radical SAM methylthiotransferase [Actinomycetota bacterium]|nr:MiaB/RimO family radical SAM methylthiotransferase [Actinomycetota bacterium]